MKATVEPALAFELSNAPLTQVKESSITALAGLVAILATVATLGGVLTAFGHIHRSFVTLYGETVTIQGGGLYGHESTSMAAQGVGMDLVTLLVATPLLLIASYLAAKGSLRGRLLRVGAFWYFTYSYLVIVFGVTYNPFFLIYVTILAASLGGLVLSVFAVDVVALPDHISAGFARRTIAWAVIAVSAMFLLMWLSRILPGMASGKPPVGLESYTTLTVQAADLALVIPVSIITGLLLLRRQPLGYLLVVPVLLFLATMGLGLVGMVVAMASLGTTVSAADYVPAGVTAVLGVGMALHLVLNITQELPASHFDGRPREPAH